MGLGSLEPCARDTECRSGECARLAGRCVSVCSAARQGCPDGEVCIAQEDGDDFGECRPTCRLDGDCPEGLACNALVEVNGVTTRICN